MVALGLAACAGSAPAPKPAPAPAPEPTPTQTTAPTEEPQPFHLKDYVFEDDWDAGPAVPHKHDDWRYGNYIDRKTHQPSLGVHSHDPVKGNAE